MIMQITECSFKVRHYGKYALVNLLLKENKQKNMTLLGITKPFALKKL